MICPYCNSHIQDPIEHVKNCEIDPNRLYNVGLISLEELKTINSKDDTSRVAAPDVPKHDRN